MSLKLSIVIINWNGKEFLQKCIDSVYTTLHLSDFELFVVDNASTDGSQDMVKSSYPGISLIENQENLGFAKANNKGIRRAKGEYVVLLNCDLVLTDHALDDLVSFLDSNPYAGAVAPQYLNEDGSKQNSFDNYPRLTTELLNKSLLRMMFPNKYPSKIKEYENPIQVECLIGACIMFRHKALDQVGLLDEGYFFYMDDPDICLRLKKKGWEVFHVPTVRIYHIQGHVKKVYPEKSWIEYYRSNYRFFRLHSTIGSYLVLRLFKLLKLIINLFLTSIGLVFTLGKNKNIRRKMRIYFYLFWWHLKLCPNNMGIKELS